MGQVKQQQLVENGESWQEAARACTGGKLNQLIYGAHFASLRELLEEKNCFRSDSNSFDHISERRAAHLICITGRGTDEVCKQPSTGPWVGYRCSPFSVTGACGAFPSEWFIVDQPISSGLTLS